ncbi:hypothetical protein IJT93_08595 [bacterium]|nr:hypothetical protein [bacterium]
MVFPNVHYPVPIFVTALLLLFLIYISIFGRDSSSWKVGIRNRVLEALFIALVGWIFIPNVTMGSIPLLNALVPGRTSAYGLSLTQFAVIWLVLGSILSVVACFIKRAFSPAVEVTYVKPKEAAPQEDRNINVTINQMVTRADDEEKNKAQQSQTPEDSAKK